VSRPRLPFRPGPPRLRLDENLLRELLRRCVTDLEVTRADFLHAEHRYHRRRAALARRRVRFIVAAVGGLASASAAALILAQLLGERGAGSPDQDLAAVPAPAQPLSPTAENLAGLWMVPHDSGWLWALSADGTFTARNPGLDPTNPGRSVPFTLDGHRLRLPEELCDFEVALVPGGRVVLDPVRVERCPVTVGEEFTLTRLSPASDAGAALAWSGQDVEIRTVEWAGSLRGVYLRQGTGVTLLVEFDTSAGRATYRLDDDGGLFHDPDDEGSLTLLGNGDLRLTSSIDSIGCEPGSQVDLVDPLMHVGAGSLPPLSRTLEVAGTWGAACELHDLTGTWIRVS